ncbi:carotenoid biosynthesis protein [Streptomyces sp. NPDC058274]|uniref:carotenoid biosynthesis protein n=1 Tax=Streptomyces sp. NPDC058274 TaxID=3346416 RepID=UPI0036E4EEE2
MSVGQRSPSTTILWVVVTVAALGEALNAVIPHSLGAPLSFITMIFPLLHGARRYGWRAMGVYLVLVLLISNALENLSIATGFPFGNYHYTGSGKIFEVPWIIGFAYASYGYLAWIIGNVLFAEVRRGSTWLTTIGTPVVASFAMVDWDLSMDPSASTIRHNWIWEDGGGFFGVPLANFLGWSLTVYLFFQIFALYLRRSGPRAGERPPSSDVQPVLLYAAIAVNFFAEYARGDRKIVTDALGHTWHTGDIYQTSALTTVYGMVFVALMAFLRIAQRRAPAAGPAPVTAGERDVVDV